MIGDYNQKRLSVIPQTSIVWYSPLGKKRVITQVHTYIHIISLLLTLVLDFKGVALQYILYSDLHFFQHESQGTTTKIVGDQKSKHLLAGQELTLHFM